MMKSHYGWFIKPNKGGGELLSMKIIIVVLVFILVDVLVGLAKSLTKIGRAHV